MRRFSYNEKVVSALERSISQARLSTYVRLVGNGSKQDALDLYALNSRLSGAFIFLLQAVEVTLRNRFNIVLSENFGTDWLTNGRISHGQWQIREIRIASNDSSSIRIDSLMYGFWASFFNRHYYLLWRSDLHKMFIDRPPIFTRSFMFSIFDRIRLFRNRVAHHEQIISHDPMRVRDDIVAAIGWLDPDQAAWLDHYDEAPEQWALIQAEKRKRGWCGF